MIDRIREYRLPNPSTPEDLEMNFKNVLTFGERVLVAGYRYNGKDDRCYFAAVYEFLDDDRDIESVVGVRAVSGLEFEDDGHAIQWAMAQ